MMKETNQSNHYKPLHQTSYFMTEWVTLQLGWKILESESYLKKDVCQKGRFCVILARILAVSEALSQSRMSLTVSNALLGSDILLGINDDGEA